MKKRERIEKAVFLFAVLSGLIFISFNLSRYNSLVVGVVFFSLILVLAGFIYGLVELRGAGDNKHFVFKAEADEENFTIDHYYHRGKMYYLQGKTDKAVKEFKRILILNPDDSDAHYQLGKICQERGRKKQAAKFLKKYLELDKTNKWREEAGKILSVLDGNC